MIKKSFAVFSCDLSLVLFQQPFEPAGSVKESLSLLYQELMAASEFSYQQIVIPK